MSRDLSTQTIMSLVVALITQWIYIS